MRIKLDVCVERKRIYDRGEKNRIRGYAIKLSSLSLFLSLSLFQAKERKRENVSDAGCSGKRHPFRVHSV